jgi:hypothetical protein
MGEFKTFIDQVTQSTYYKGANILQYSDGGGELYISFQVLLKFLDEYVNMKSNGKSVISIDWESDKPFFAFSTSVSFNLLKCYLYNNYVPTSDGAFVQNNIQPFEAFNKFTTAPVTSTQDGKTTVIVSQQQADQNKKIEAINSKYAQNKPAGKAYLTYPQVGNINHIYLNAGFVAEQMTKQADAADSAVSIRKLLQAICDEIGKALGSINDFQVIIDDDENIITIVDYNQKRIKGLADIGGSEVTTIKAQGLGSFVTGISAQSSITPELATMISIGAQANGNKPGVEAVSFSLMNKGLIDRFYVEKSPPGETDKTDQDLLAKSEKDRSTKYQETRTAYITFIANQKESSDKVLLKSTDKLNLENICSDFYKTLIGAFTNSGQASTSFIPVKLDISLAGMSGIKIFQRFTLSGDVLPYTYKDNFDFVIMGVSHEVSSNGVWTTKLSAIIALKEEITKTSTGTFMYIGDTETEGASTGGTSTGGASKSLAGKFKGSTTISTAETVSFMTDVLKGLGITNPNEYQIQFMVSWRQHEGAQAAWNPLNSTIKKPGATIYNYATVKNYPDRATGLSATIDTLKLKYYIKVRKAIKDIKVENDIDKAMQAVNDSPWGSNFIPPKAGSWKRLTNLIYKDPIEKRG